VWPASRELLEGQWHKVRLTCQPNAATRLDVNGARGPTVPLGSIDAAVNTRPFVLGTNKKFIVNGLQATIPKVYGRWRATIEPSYAAACWDLTRLNVFDASGSSVPLLVRWGSSPHAKMDGPRTNQCGATVVEWVCEPACEVERLVLISSITVLMNVEFLEGGLLWMPAWHADSIPIATTAAPTMSPEEQLAANAAAAVAANPDEVTYDGVTYTVAQIVNFLFGLPGYQRSAVIGSLSVQMQPLVLAGLEAKDAAASPQTTDPPTMSPAEAAAAAKAAEEALMTPEERQIIAAAEAEQVRQAAVEAAAADAADAARQAAASEQAELDQTDADAPWMRYPAVQVLRPPHGHSTSNTTLCAETLIFACLIIAGRNT